MDAKEYQKLAARTLIDKPGFDLSDQELMAVWDALGLGGEAGEVLDLIKKGIFHRHGIDPIKISEEIGDTLWYVAALCTTLGLDLSEIMEKNIAKLKIRYPDGYSSENSIKRVDIVNQSDRPDDGANEEDKTRGLYAKYEVRKKDTGELLEGCFVLRPDKDKAAGLALVEYMRRTPNKKLAEDLREWLNRITGQK